MTSPDMATIPVDVTIVCRSPHGLPAYSTPLSAGMDLRAWLPDGPLTLQPLQRALVPTGIRIALPPGYECQIRPRSGMALKRGLTVLNSPGTIDADYRGEVGVIIVNLGQEPQTIADGSYPLRAPIYAAIHKDTPPDAPARRIFDFLTTPAGQKLVQAAGYVPVTP